MPFTAKVLYRQLILPVLLPGVLLAQMQDLVLLPDWTSQTSCQIIFPACPSV